MGKGQSFQDLTLGAPLENQERWRWFYNEIRRAILDGRLRPGSRLPATRNLAAQYEVSRGTVVAAFDHLRSEGYLDSQIGAGTFVASDLPEDALKARPSRAASPAATSQASISRRGQVASSPSMLLRPSVTLGKAFRAYEPAIDLFPTELWSRVSSRVLRRAPRTLYAHGDAHGYLPLRRAITEYVGAARGVKCTPEQILITSGAQQALDLIGRILLDPGDRVVTEDPAYPGLISVLNGAGARVTPVPVDSAGLQVDKLPQAKLAYVTPANQFPLGVAMPVDRRLALIRWAMRNKAWIIEDDYDSEYRYRGHPVSSLQSLDRTGSVIYVGTFTKMLFPSLRLGFLILPERVVENFARAKSTIDRHTSTLDQAVLADFMMEGHFGHHVRRMRQVYAERAGVLVDAARARLGGQVDVALAEAGMRTIGWLRGLDELAVATAAQAQGLELAPLSMFTIRHPQPAGLVLGFAAVSESELRRGVDVLAAVLEQTGRTLAFESNGA